MVKTISLGIGSAKNDAIVPGYTTKLSLCIIHASNTIKWPMFSSYSWKPFDARFPVLGI